MLRRKQPRDNSGAPFRRGNTDHLSHARPLHHPGLSRCRRSRQIHHRRGRRNRLHRNVAQGRQFARHPALGHQPEGSPHHRLCRQRHHRTATTAQGAQRRSDHRRTDRTGRRHLPEELYVQYTGRQRHRPLYPLAYGSRHRAERRRRHECLSVAPQHHHRPLFAELEHRRVWHVLRQQ